MYPITKFYKYFTINFKYTQDLRLRFTKNTDSSVTVQTRGPGGATTEAIRRDRVKSSRVPLAALGVISPWNPLSTLSFHQENSAIAEGLVPLRVPGLD